MRITASFCVALRHIPSKSSIWKEQNTANIQVKIRDLSLKAVNDTTDEFVRLWEDFHGLITSEEQNKHFLLRYVQEDKKLCRDWKKVLEPKSEIILLCYEKYKYY